MEKMALEESELYIEALSFFLFLCQSDQMVRILKWMAIHSLHYMVVTEAKSLVCQTQCGNR